MRKMLLLTCLSALLAGCGPTMDSYMDPSRQENGLVMILPGIEGISGYNLNIKKGLVGSGLKYAITIQPWGAPMGLVINQMNVLGNRLEGQKIARWISQEYLEKYPGRPVWLIGHSGGGGIAVFTAEAMPRGKKITGLVLLSASLHKDYDISKAMANLEYGIVNYYNPSDSALLELGTTLTSNVDGMRGPSAGLRGFSSNHPKLHDVRITGSGGDPHGAATRPSFIRHNVVPWLRRGSAVAISD
ncbi:MAG: hypothetical protein ACLFUJ_13320 [Phycisphaerae bacterium]